ncbi:MAG: radical SAM protein [Pseudobutyrivibrio sp.]|uniref:radical SAM protein n=1 Tax=Pseudobutyrivibrio sp. TaxID=2014367 RepID=UPI0025EFF953|nr:radical SAM protein [Pseudobutyrivibrio sp.]MBQ8490093.1 radical SAM protein [Pseudobutyrivibrio sp.]
MRLTFELTQKCNMNCVYCNAEKSDESCQSLEVIEQVCKEFSEKDKIDYIALTGGESLLYKDFGEAVDLVSKYTEHILILTNGLLLNDERVLQVIKKYNVEIHVSVDSIHSDYHDRVRGHRDKILNNIQQIKNEVHVPIALVCVLSRYNVSEIRDINVYCKENGFNLEFELLNIDNSSELSIEKLTPKEIQRVVEDLEEWANDFNNHVKYRLLKVVLQNRNFTPSVCYGCKNNYIVFADGNVGPCFLNKSLMYGNVRDKDFFLTAVEKNKRNYDGACFSYKCLGNYL